jgi:serine/threonine-protein kinase
MTELPASFGKYFLTEKLATGGMAEIYLAKLVGPGGFEKQLVIKQIHPTLAAEPHFVDLFVAEAKTLVGLSHGNIVPVYELGIVDDTYFIAMEYIDGPTLYRFTEAVWRAGDAIDPDVAAYIAARILEGLDYAHRRGDGVIHRDLSPRNVMLSRDGEVKLVDFGIAVAFGAGDDPAGDGAPTGSFPYMSPEQVRRERLTTASDLFSAGVLLWEMLAGQRLFARPTPEATLDAVVHEPIPAPSTLRPGVPRRLDEVVMRALERDASRRWASAGDALAAIHRHLYSPEAEQVPTARRLAALVARYCPPIVEDAAAVPLGAGAAPTTAAPAGPATVVVPRRAADADAGAGADEAPPVTTSAAAPDDDGATQVSPRGKRGGTVREHSFATHVELEAVLSGTPLFGVRALRDVEPLDAAPAPDAAAAAPAAPDAGPTTHPHPRRATAERAVPAPARAARVAAPDEHDDDAARTATTLPPVRGRRAARAALAFAMLAAVAVLTLWWTRPAPSTPAGAVDAAATSWDAGPGRAPVDAGPAVDAGPVRVPVDAGPVRVPVDAGPVRVPVDAGRPVRVDAGPSPAIDAAARATGVIKVGADPWGEVTIDGRRVGNAPNQWTVPTGAHVVEVTHPADDGVRKQTFHVDVQPDEIESVFADFSP